MNIIEQLEREQVTRATERQVPRLPAGRHAAGERQGDRGQPRARAGLRGRVHRAAQPRRELGLHGAQDLLRRRRRARVPALQPAHRQIEVVRSGGVRRAKLYYLRGRSGKARPHRRARQDQRQKLAEASAAHVPAEAEKEKPEDARRRRRAGRRQEAGHHGGLQEVGSREDGHVVGRAHPVREDLGQPPRRAGARRHLPPLHRPPPRPRGDEPAGLRGPARLRPQGAPARRDAGRPRPQRRRRPTARGRSRTRPRASRSRPWRRTAPSSASRCSAWTTSARASSTSSAPSRASPCRA